MEIWTVTRPTLWAGVICLLAGGCASQVPTSGPTASEGVDGSSVGGDGSVGNPRLLTCKMAAFNEPLSIQPSDIIAGPLSYPDAHSFASPGGEARPIVNGMTFYKQGTFVQDGSTVTVRVAPRARSFASLQSVAHPSGGDLAVTYKSCPSGGVSSWIGGFNLKGRTTACVPLDIAVQGENFVRHVVISLSSGTCSA